MAQKTAAWTGFTSPNGAAFAAEEITYRAPRGRRRKWVNAGPGACIPIVNDAHDIVGWTQAAPTVENGRLRHPEAERAVRGPIFCTQIALLRPQDIVRAGGPAGWMGPWRCLALCPVANAHGLAHPPGAAALGTPRGAARGRSPAPRSA